MPTTGKRRSRQLRRLPGSAIERFIRGEIDADELNAEHGNPFTEFAITSRDTTLGKQAFEIWQRDGAALLAEHHYQGKRRHPDYNIVDYGDLPPNLVSLVSAYGEPWK